MTPDALRAMYRRRLANFDVVTLRRYAGTGVSRTATNYASIKARVVGYGPRELVGPIQEGDQMAIILQEDLTTAGFTGKILEHDKLVVGTKEYSIIAPDGASRRVGGEIIAYELTIRG